MENTKCPSLFSDLMSYRAVGANVLLFKRYGFMDFLSACWISAVTWRSTLSEQGSDDGSSPQSTLPLNTDAASFSTYSQRIPQSACKRVSVDSSCPHFHPNFFCNDNTPNNSPNPSTPHCSITVFRKMGLGAETAGEERRGQYVDGGMSWAEGWGGREGRKRIRGRRDCFLLPWKAADEETGTAVVGKSQIACHQPTAHWSV